MVARPAGLLRLRVHVYCLLDLFTPKGCFMKMLWLCALALAWTCGARAADDDAATKIKLTVGQMAPDFSIPSTAGGNATLADYNGDWLVLCFYAKSFTPGPAKEVAALRDDYARITKMGAVVLCASRDELETQKKFKTENKLPFELLADTEKTLATAYDVIGFGGLYQRRSFLIDPKGKIAHIFYGVTVNKHGEEVVDALRKIQAEAAGP